MITFCRVLFLTNYIHLLRTTLYIKCTKMRISMTIQDNIIIYFLVVEGRGEPGSEEIETFEDREMEGHT